MCFHSVSQKSVYLFLITATGNAEEWLDDDLVPSQGKEKERDIVDNWKLGGAIPRSTTMRPPDARVMENFENEVDTLGRRIQNLLTEIYNREQAIPIEKPIVNPF